MFRNAPSPDALPKVAIVALGALLLVQIGLIAAEFAVPIAPRTQVRTPRAPPVDVSVFERFDPFFRAPAAGEAEAAEPVIGVQLFGVRVAPGARGSAILESNGVQAAYRIGEEVQPGVVLAQVGADHVIVERGGARTRIDFAPRAAPPPLPVAPTPTVSTPPALAPQGAAPAPQGAAPVPQGAAPAPMTDPPRP